MLGAEEKDREEEIMEAHRIAVISDTHGILLKEVLEQIESCEAILHAGDMDNPEILHKLQAVRPTFCVAGNADVDWAEDLPKTLTVELFGFRLYLIHNRKQMPKDLPELDLVIFGHSHKYEETKEGKITYLNPGSCGRRRFRLPLTMMILTLYPKSHEFAVERIELTASALPSGGADTKASKKDMYKLVKTVIKDMDAGKSVAEIASKAGVDRDLVEQICRMYATHPGVDVDGILDRLERRNL